MDAKPMRRYIGDSGGNARPAGHNTHPPPSYDPNAALLLRLGLDLLLGPNQTPPPFAASQHFSPGNRLGFAITPLFLSGNCLCNGARLLICLVT